MCCKLTVFFSVFCLCLLLFFLDVRLETELETDDLESQRGSVRKRWIRKKFDADGYFLLQLVERIDRRDMFLTADGTSSLTIKGTYSLNITNTHTTDVKGSLTIYLCITKHFYLIAVLMASFNLLLCTR